MTQRKELQKHSNILLKSFGVSDFLTVIASLPAVTSTILISFQGFLELVCTIYNEAMKLGFLVTCSQYHLTMVAWERFVAVRQWMDYKVIVTKRRLITIPIFAIGWLSAIFTRGCLYTLWGVTSADTEPKRIWIMITNACAMLNVVIFVYFYAMIYHGIRQRRTSDKVMLHETIRNDDFLRNTALQNDCCDIISNGYNIVPTLQRCVAVKIVVANRFL